MKVVSKLTEMKCTACRPDAPQITELEIVKYQPQIPNWRLVERDNIWRLERVFKFDDFKQALAFTQCVGELAEEAHHHPTLLTAWGKVTITWWTTAIKGLHRNDFIMAAKTDEIYHSKQQTPTSEFAVGVC